jgi:excinuclease ABC subunit B
MKFKLVSPFAPTGDQPEAIEKLVQGIKKDLAHQVLLGVTGSGKTFTIAKVIEKIQKPTLVISHNKTLAAQLYQEFRDFFPQNEVSYFVSYYDYYQPEAYLPQTDTYIEKETDINQEIEKLRLKATSSLLSKKAVIVVASVSCIYNLGSPQEYARFALKLKAGQKISRNQILKQLVRLRYRRSDYDFVRGTFRVRGEVIDVFPAYEDQAIRIQLEKEKIGDLKIIDPLSGRIEKEIDSLIFYPARHYIARTDSQEEVFAQIRKDLKKQVAYFKKQGKEIEAYRLKTRVNYDLEQIKEFGYVTGIENYSRYFDGRKPGEPPFTLLDYFPKSYLLIIDESHMTIPQIRGMHEGDASRKKTLINYGFRLPAAKDNRPLKFAEFLTRVNQVIYTSATPSNWEIKRAKKAIVEQLIRPTGIVDPGIDIRPVKGQIEDLIKEIFLRVDRGERVLVTTLTKRMAEDLAQFLKKKAIKVHHLHSEIDTLDRVDILDDLRLGKYDVVVGINLLREGLDLPEVSLVAILDADKEGFLRSETSLIQVMGRAARHVHGAVVMYADQMTGSMRRAINEIKRRRQIQVEYNRQHKITPQTIKKPIREKLIEREKKDQEKILKKKKAFAFLDSLDPKQLVPMEKKRLLRTLKRQMRQAAADLEFELAAEIRDKITEIKDSPSRF